MATPHEFADSVEKFEEREYFEGVHANVSFLIHGSLGQWENLCSLALMYHHGLGVETDHEKAILYYRYAILLRRNWNENTHDIALDGLRELTGSPVHNISELTTKTFPDVAAEAEGMTAEDMYRQARLYLTGICAPFDNDFGQAWLLQAARNGHIEAALEAADNFITGRHIIIQDLAAARVMLLPLAEDARVLMLLGDTYNKSNSTESDRAIAREYYEKALERAESPQDVQILYKLVTLRAKDTGGTGKCKFTIRDFRALQEQVKAAAVKSGAALQKGQGGNSLAEREKEFTRLFELDTKDGYYQAAMLVKGNALFEYDFWKPDVVYRLGRIQEFGLCGEPNFYGAGSAYRNAAQRGHAEAMARLGMLHEAGKGVRRSISQARKWYAAAVAAGNKEAEAKLATLPEPAAAAPEEWDTPEFRKVLTIVRALGSSGDTIEWH